VSFLAITMLHIVLGELAPKWVALRKGASAAMLVSLPLFVFYRLTYPAIWLLNRSARGLMVLLRMAPPSENEGIHGEEELRRLLASDQTSSVPDQQRELLDNVFEMSHRLARQVMLPRSDVVYLSTRRPPADELRLARRSGHTRFPLCDGDLDH